jgi:Protein of unknown function (DUF3486)
MPRRKKVDELPEEVRKELDHLLSEKAFGDFRGLEAWLEERGFLIGKSSIHRYSQDFQARMEALKTATEQARAIAEVCGDDENSLGDARLNLYWERASAEYSTAIATMLTIGLMLTENNSVGRISNENSPKSPNGVESPAN